MDPNELPEEQRAEWERLNAAFDAAEDSGDGEAVDALGEQITAFVRAHGISDGCDFDPDDDPPPAPAPADPETVRRAMLQAAADGDDTLVEELKALAVRK